MFPHLLIHETLTRAVFSVGETADMPTELSWLETVWGRFGTVGLIVALFGWSVLKTAQWWAPRIDTRLAKQNQLVETATAAVKEIEEIREDQRILARVYERLHDVVYRGCGKEEPPPSDTDTERVARIAKRKPHEKKPEAQ